MTGNVAVRNRFPRGEVTNMFFDYFESSNEKTIGRDGREGEMRGSMVKCVEIPLEGGKKEGGGGGKLWSTCRWIFGACYMGLLDYVTRLQKNISLV